MREIINLMMGLSLLLLGLWDIKTRRISVWMLLSLSVFVTIAVLFFREKTLLDTFAGALIGVGFFIVSKKTKENIGYGDSWILLLLGVFQGGMALMKVVFWACVLICGCSLLISLKRGWHKERTLPFVPFLAVAYGVVVFW